MCLIIYKASAGSGKTYTLTKEYIGLLLRGWFENRVSKHDRILAATFTNKATIELRERIIRELIRIRDGEPANLGMVVLEEWRQNSEITETEYQKRGGELTSAAGSLLHAILEDYGSFRVQTIDSFFQEVVRSFALEMSSLAGAYNIELEEKDFITMSLDQLFIRLGEQGKENIHHILAEIYKQDDESGEDKVNIREQLIELTESFLARNDLNESLSEDKYSIDKCNQARTLLIDTAAQCKTEVIERLARFAERFGKIEVQYQIDYAKSLRGFLKNIYQIFKDEKKIVSEYFEKGNPIFTETQWKIVDEKQSLTPQTVGKNISEGYKLADSDLRELLDDILDYEKQLDEVRRKYYTAVLISKYIDLMPALFEAKKAVEEYQREQNVVLISRINNLLKDIIAGADVPFIYDKVGTRIEHYMIDEFQDTNHLQWENFTPLLEESLSYGRSNYLVGDVKQSIYRFRGADSSLLGEEVVKNSHASVKALGTNWRSHRNIVDFNNRFFEGIYGDISGLNSDIQPVEAHKSVYDNDVRQEAHHQEGGYVELNFVQKDEVKDDFLKLIVELQDEYDFHRRDIAILVYKNKEANMVANWLTEASANNPEMADKFNFISDEALTISSSQTVLLLAQYISYVANNRTPQKEIELRLYLQMFLNMFEGKYDENDVNKVLNNLIDLSKRDMGLFESITNVINILPDIPENEMVYVNAFMDHLFSFASKNTATFRLFEDWWNRAKDNLKVEMGGIAQDSISILTIHKSKGLEYPVVIMPLADREFSKKSGNGSIKLFKGEDELKKEFELDFPYYYLESSPKKKNLNTYFKPQYLSGMEEDFMDNLNLLYVAFTRAAQHLYVYGPEAKKSNKATGSKKSNEAITKTGDFIYRRIQYVFGLKTDQFTFGVREKASHRSPSQSLSYELTTLSASPKYDHLEFTIDKYMSSKMKEGTILHRILERSRTKEDFHHAVTQAHKSLLIDEEKAKELRERFELAVKDNSTIAEWFTPHPDQVILSEASISERMNEPLHRPDRMILDTTNNTVTVVDYKFGEPHPRYKTQIQSYARLLREMGYETKGYLWYNLSANPADLTMITNE